jgi:riboflavin biosynthesis pyrimidine reductase
LKRAAAATIRKPFTGAQRASGARRIGTMAALDAAERIEARARELFGELRRDVGVLHVAAVAREPGGGLRVLRIGPRTPASDADRFSLSLARASVDAILTTGQILRDEPEVTHELLEEAEDLRAWRAARLGREGPARSAVLTRGAEIDLDHPLLRGAWRPLILTSPRAAIRLQAEAARRGIEVVGLEALDARAALAELRARGASGIGVEAGPATALALYDAPVAVDELWLSVFEGPLPPGVAGAPFLDAARLDRIMPCAAPARRIVEPSGPWRFERRVCRP